MAHTKEKLISVGIGMGFTLVLLVVGLATNLVAHKPAQTTPLPTYSANKQIKNDSFMVYDNTTWKDLDPADRIGINQTIAQGRAVVLPAGTTVQVLDTKDFELHSASAGWFIQRSERVCSVYSMAVARTLIQEP